NLETYPPPPTSDKSMSQVIVARSRRYYAKPRAEVEALFQTRPKTSATPAAPKPSAAKPVSAAKSPADTTPPEPREEDWNAWDDYVA
ncbi:MAG: hypothetical protein KDB27_09950, partial [Planctomycetales bacterium]|nr:hypothetical protein [Planctomycetales bacterium]